MIKLFIVLTLLFIFSTQQVFAIVDPLSTPNNRFGIHIIDENDIDDAQRLVNSNGGEWGYVTLVIQDTDLDHNKWQIIFDKLREAHLIPLVRLATHGDGSIWVKPTTGDAVRWADFLTSLNWVVQNRYIIIFNEPNHSQEWGGTINPGEYASIARTFHDELKNKSGDFYILPAGFDAAAPNSKETEEIGRYLKQMQQFDSSIFSIFDGWTSHSYPNPAFKGSPSASGKGTVRSWQWETNFAHSLGLGNVPVFITETGWVHYEGKESNVLGISSDTVGKFYQDAFKNAWNNSQVVAVTPFVLNYQDKPFDNFSFKKIGNSGYYPQFDSIVELDKVRGLPIQGQNSQLVKNSIPSVLIENSSYNFTATYRNIGQSIWSTQDDYSFKINGILFGLTSEVLPGNERTIPFQLTTSDQNLVAIGTLVHNNLNFGQEFKDSIYIIKSPSLSFQPTVIFGNIDNIQLKFLDNGELIKTISDFERENGSSLKTSKLENLIPNHEYEVQIIKEGYTMSKSRFTLKEGENIIKFNPMFPKPNNFFKFFVPNLSF